MEKAFFTDCGQNIHIQVDEDLCDFSGKGYFQILLLEKGMLTIKIGNKISSFIAPIILAINEDAQVTYVKTNSQQYGKKILFPVSFLHYGITYDFIHSGEYQRNYEKLGLVPLEIFTNEKVLYEGLPLTSEDYLYIRDLFDKFQSVVRDHFIRRWSCMARVYLNELLEHLDRIFYAAKESEVDKIDMTNPSQWVSLMVNTIHRKYKEDLSLSSLSKEFYINKTTVSVWFKRITGHTVTEYISQYRIHCARYFLSTTLLSVKQISEEIGYKQASYFIRQFKKVTGMTPLAFRKQCKLYRKDLFTSSI